MPYRSERWKIWRGLRSCAPRGWQKCRRRGCEREMSAYFRGGRFAVQGPRIDQRQEFRNSGWVVADRDPALGGITYWLFTPEDFALNYAIIGPSDETGLFWGVF